MFGSVLLFFSCFSNKLYSDKLSGNQAFKAIRIYYTNDQYNSLGGVEGCLFNALEKNLITNDGMFFGTFMASTQFLILGYRYGSGRYGVVLLYKYDGSTIRYNINDGNITKS